MSYTVAEEIERKLQFFDNDRDATQNKLVGVLISLVEDRQDPRSAAQELHDAAIADYEKTLLKFNALPEGMNPHHEKWPLAPKPGSWDEGLQDLVGTGCQPLPADHPGHDRWVSLLVELQELPKTNVKVYSGDRDELYDHELWTMNSQNNWNGMREWMRELDCSFHGQEMNTSAEKRSHFINFQSMMARLFGRGVVDTRNICPLSNAWVNDYEFANRDPTNERHSISPKYETSIEAAAQWIFYAGPAYLECDGLRGFRGTKSRWHRYKEKFEFIGSCERFSPHCQEIATRAAKRMAEIEVEGPSQGIEAKLGQYPLQARHRDWDEQEAEEALAENDTWEYFGGHPEERENAVDEDGEEAEDETMDGDADDAGEAMDEDQEVARGPFADKRGTKRKVEVENLND